MATTLTAAQEKKLEKARANVESHDLGIEDEGSFSEDKKVRVSDNQLPHSIEELKGDWNAMVANWGPDYQEWKKGWVEDLPELAPHLAKEALETATSLMNPLTLPPALDPSRESLLRQMPESMVQQMGTIASNPRKHIVENPFKSALFAAEVGTGVARFKGLTTPQMLADRVVKSGLTTVADALKLGAQYQRMKDLLENVGVGGLAIATDFASGNNAKLFTNTYHAAKHSETRYANLVEARIGSREPSDIIELFLESQAKLLDEAKIEYQANLGTLKLKDPDIPLDIPKVLNETLDEISKDFNIEPVIAQDIKMVGPGGNFTKGKRKGKPRGGGYVPGDYEVSMLPVKGSAHPFQLAKAEQSSLSALMGYMFEQALAGDNTIRNVDNIKQAIWMSIKENAQINTSQADAIKLRLFGAIRKELGDKVDNYDKTMKAYESKRAVYEKTEDVFSLKQDARGNIKSAQAALNKMKSIFSDADFTAADKTKLMAAMSERVGVDLESTITGMMSQQYKPKGLVARSAGVGAFAFGLASAKMMAMLPLMSPRIASGIFGGLGKGTRAWKNTVKGFEEDWLKPLHKNITDRNLWFQTATYADAARMALMSDPEALIYKASRVTNEESKNILERLGIHPDRLDQKFRFDQ